MNTTGPTELDQALLLLLLLTGELERRDKVESLAVAVPVPHDEVVESLVELELEGSVVKFNANLRFRMPELHDEEVLGDCIIMNDRDREEVGMT